MDPHQMNAITKHYVIIDPEEYWFRQRLDEEGWFRNLMWSMSQGKDTLAPTTLHLSPGKMPNHKNFSSEENQLYIRKGDQ